MDVDYLERKWTSKEIENFVTATDRVIKFISKHPKMFRKTNRKNVQRQWSPLTTYSFTKSMKIELI